MHTDGRSAADIDAGGILDGYAGTLVHDGYAHLLDVHHAWREAHYPDLWVMPMWVRSVLVGGGCSGWAGRDNHSASRNARWPASACSDSPPAKPAGGLPASRRAPAQHRRTAAGMHAPSHLHDRDTDVLRFAHDLQVPPTSNQAERDLRPA